MAPLDLTGGLPDLDAAAPAGPNLEFDAEFGALERAAQGKPEQQYGDAVIPAEDPTWPEVAALATALLERTHDLRVLVHLAVARLHISGLDDFVAVLAMIHQQVETRWECVHPQLDPEDDNDPTFRANALLQLAEPLRVLRVLRDLPLAASKRDGAVSWRIIGIFNGSIEAASDQDRKTEAIIRAAFLETGGPALAVRHATIDAGIHAASGITSAFDSNGGAGTGPDLTALVKLLQEMRRYIGQFMPEPDAPLPQVEDVLEESEAAAPAGASAARARPMSATSLTSVGTRAEALHLLDVVCRYYQQNEPSSPLPLLIDRARKLADKGFLEILEELAPDGLMQAQNVVRSRAT